MFSISDIFLFYTSFAINKKNAWVSCLVSNSVELLNQKHWDSPTSECKHERLNVNDLTALFYDLFDLQTVGYFSIFTRNCINKAV